MSTEHDPRHHDELLELFCSAADPSADFERSPLATCPVCRAELDALLEVGRELDALATDTRGAIRDAHAEPSAPGEARVDAWLRERLPATSAGEPARATSVARPRRPGSVWWFAGALAAGLLVFLALRDRGETPGPGPGPDPGPPLSGGEFALEALQTPGGAAGSWTEFRWRGTLPAGGWFVVRVSGEDGALLLESPPLHDTRWEPTAEERTRLPRAFRWEVIVFDDTGQPQDARSDSYSPR